MTREELLLIHLSEECGELTQAIGKALKFGLKETYLKTGKTNLERISEEYNDIRCLMEMLEDMNLVECNIPSYSESRKEKTESYFDYIKDCGRYEEGESVFTENNGMEKIITDGKFNEKVLEDEFDGIYKSEIPNTTNERYSYRINEFIIDIDNIVNYGNNEFVNVTLRHFTCVYPEIKLGVAKYLYELKAIITNMEKIRYNPI